MHAISIGGKTVSVFPGAEPESPVIYLNTFSEEGQQVWDAAEAAGCPSFSLVAISGLDWNHDMVPWDSPPAFQRAQPCTGGADDYLRLLTSTILPAAERLLAGTPRWRGIAGYSLAGLFAVYAIYQTDMFSRVGSMSGSLWFPGIKEYVLSHMCMTNITVPQTVIFNILLNDQRNSEHAALAGFLLGDLQAVSVPVPDNIAGPKFQYVADPQA